MVKSDGGDEIVGAGEKALGYWGVYS